MRHPLPTEAQVRAAAAELLTPWAAAGRPPRHWPPVSGSAAPRSIGTTCPWSTSRWRLPPSRPPPANGPLEALPPAGTRTTLPGCGQQPGTPPARADLRGGHPATHSRQRPTAQLTRAARRRRRPDRAQARSLHLTVLRHHTTSTAPTAASSARARRARLGSKELR